MSTIRVQSVPGFAYKQQITSGNQVFYSDVSQSQGGNGSAPSPHDLLLGAIGACTAMTMKMVAQNKKIPLEDVTVTLEETKVTPEGATSSVPLLRKTIEMTGDFTEDQLTRLKRAAEVCPVNKLVMNPNKQEEFVFSVTPPTPLSLLA